MIKTCVKICKPLIGWREKEDNDVLVIFILIFLEYYIANKKKILHGNLLKL